MRRKHVPAGKVDPTIERALQRFPQIVAGKRKAFLDRKKFLQRYFLPVLEEVFGEPPLIRPKLDKRRRGQARAPESRPLHPWRLCPAGKHYREAASVGSYSRKDGTWVRAHPRQGTCADNPSGRDQLYPEEMREITQRNFPDFLEAPLPSLSKFGESGNQYDHLIQGWTRYWNEVLRPAEPLRPTLIKALIASESSFNSRAWNRQRGPGRARGLMQVTDRTVRHLSDHDKELRDHFLNLVENDMLDPSLSICAGTRWLFRKREVAASQARGPVSWRDAVVAFKGILPDQLGLMEGFDRYLRELEMAK